MKPRMLKIVALGLLLTPLSQFVKAAPVGPEELAQLLKFYAPIRSLSVPFQQIKHLTEMGVDLRSEGRLEVHRPDEIIWEIIKPSHLTVVIDKSAVRLTEGEGPSQVFELAKLSKDNAARGIGLLKPWLMLDVKTLSEQYVVTRADPQHFVFVPKSDSKMFKAMDVSLNKAGHMEKLSLHESSGDLLEIIFGAPKVVK